MRHLHVVLHLVRARELLVAHRAREHLARRALVIEERVPLEAVLVLERLLDVLFGTLGALVDALEDFRVAEQIQAAHRHLRQVLGLVVVRAGLSAAASALRLPRRRRRHRVLGLFLELLLLLLDGGGHRQLRVHEIGLNGVGQIAGQIVAGQLVVVQRVRLDLLQGVRNV